MTKCTDCKYMAGTAIYKGKDYIRCKIEGLIKKDVALDEDLDCDLYVENIYNDNTNDGSE